ncbi:helix-turn-helix transcriptional regulator [Streptomyces sp. NPDC005574]|uniref:helix-turn-helix transcriptional regulator n=1 Tax=Streptomyces sp. NPDC005574 TaxID=3156891 RepID=UPI0033A9233C
MNPDLELISRDLSAATAEAATVSELGMVISQQIGKAVPHDGYMLRGVDPLTGAACFLAKEHGYEAAFYRALETEEILGRDRHTVVALVESARTVAVLVSGASDVRHSVQHEDIMNATEVGGEMRIALTLRGMAWGVLVLLRGRGSRPFSATDAAHAERLSGPLAGTLRQYVAGRFLRPVRGAPAPGVVVIDGDDTIRAVTKTGREWVRRLVPENVTADEDEIFAHIWNIALAARQPGRQALSRIPGPDGWIVLQAQPLDEHGSGGVAVTIESASSDVLLPAAAVLYGITSREQAVIGRALEGLAVKQIARSLDLSPHTVNDHFKAIYRKTGVNSREELISSLSR